MAEDAVVSGLIVPKVTTDQLRYFLARMPLVVQNDYGRRHMSLFSYVLHRFLGQVWVETHVLAQALGTNKGPTEFMELDFASDERREYRSSRLYDLAEMLINLQFVEGFDDCIRRLRTGDEEQIEATYAELQFAKLFYAHDMNFRMVTASGGKGADYDFELFLPSHPVVCADAKCKIETHNINVASVRNTLNNARRQFPVDKPSMIFVKVPQHWFDKAGMADDLRQAARDFLRGTGRIVSVKYYVSHISFVNQQTLRRHAFDEITNPNNRFPPKRDWSLFRRDQSPKEMPRKWISLMHFK